MEFLGKIFTGVKAIAVLTNTGICAALFATSTPIAIPIVYSVVTAFTWIDLFFHVKTSRIAAEVHEEVERLHTERDKLSDAVDKSDKTVQQLQGQLAAQVELAKEAKKFIATLVSTESGLESVRDDLVASISKSESVTETLSRITTQLTGEKFTAIDVNGDGVITPAELATWSKQFKGSSALH